MRGPQGQITGLEEAGDEYTALQPELFQSVSDMLVGGTYKEDEVKWKMGSKSCILLL